MNTPSSHEYTSLHLYSFCAVGVSSNLASKVTLTRVSHGRWASLLHLGGTTFIAVDQSVPNALDGIYDA